VKHPQTNGKLERFFGEYKRHRSAFSSFEEFINWYNDRPHGSLNFQSLETPEMAFREHAQSIESHIGNRPENIFS
jgi:putative transposase